MKIAVKKRINVKIKANQVAIKKRIDVRIKANQIAVKKALIKAIVMIAKNRVKTIVRTMASATKKKKKIAAINQ